MSPTTLPRRYHPHHHHHHHMQEHPQQHLYQSRHRHHYRRDDVPISGEDTLSPSPSLPCSPEQTNRHHHHLHHQQQHHQQQQQQQSGQQPMRESLQSLREHQQLHKQQQQQQHLSPSPLPQRETPISDVSDVSEMVAARLGSSRLSITSRSSSGAGGAPGGKRTNSVHQSLSPVNNQARASPPVVSPTLSYLQRGASSSPRPPPHPDDQDVRDDRDEDDDEGDEDLSFHRFPRYYDDQYGGGEGGDESGDDNLSHDSYELIEREEDAASAYGGGSQLGSRVPSRSSSRGLIGSISGNILSSSREGLEWCESKGGGDMPTTRANTGSLPRSHGGSVTTITNGYTGSLPRTHSVGQADQLSRTLAGSRASSRITLELPLEPSPDKGEEEENMSSPGSPEFHENSVCEITSETGYGRHLGTIAITDNVSLFTPQLPPSNRRPCLERAESLTESVTGGSAALRSRSNSRSFVNRVGGSRDNLDGTLAESLATVTSRVSASIRAAKEMGQYVDYGSSQESLHKMSSCESDVGSSMSSQTRSSTTPRPSDFHPHVQFMPARRSTSTSPPTVTSGSSQARPRNMDFASLNKKPLFHVYSSGRGSDSGGNTDSDICSPLEVPLPIPSSEEVQEVDEEDEDDDDDSPSPSDDRVLFLRRPPDIGLVTRVRGSSDDEDFEHRDIRLNDCDLINDTHEEEELACEEIIQEVEDLIGEIILEEDEDLASLHIPVSSMMSMVPATRREDDQIVVVIEENPDPFLYNYQSMAQDLKEESPSSVEVDFLDLAKERKVDESEASERTVIERYMPEERLNKGGSKDSQMSIEEIDETIMDRRSSLGLERRPSYHESRKSPYLDRRLSTQELDRISPMPEKDRRPSYQEGGERRSPYLEADRKSSMQDLSRRSPYDRDRTPSNSSDRSRRGSASSDRRSSVSSERHGSISSDRRGSGSSEHNRPSLSDIGRRTSISVENDQRSPFFDTPAFEFDPPAFEFEDENVFESMDRDGSSPQNPQPAPKFTHSPPGNDTETSKSHLDHSRINMDDLVVSLIPTDDSSETFCGAKVVEVIDGGSSDSSDTKKDNVSKPSKRQPPPIAPKPTAKLASAKGSKPTPPVGKPLVTSTYEEVVLHNKPSKKTQRDVIIIKVDVEQSPQEFETARSDPDEKTKRITPKIEDMSGSSYESNQDSQEKSYNGDMSLEGAVGGGSSQYFYDDEDDHAQMSDHSSQSPDLVSEEPDEYHDEYQEPDYYQPYRQMEVGYAFPSRTLSRISERSTTSEQEQEQDHLHSEQENNETTDSKISTPSEDKHGVDHPSDIPSDLSSDYSNSNCEDAYSESNKQQSQSQSLSQSQTKSHSHSSSHHPSSDVKAPHHYSTPSNSVSAQPSASGGKLTVEEQENVNKFATHLFLCDLPEFCAGDDSDEFPSPPSSAFLENPHSELRNIESYYLDIAKQTKNSKLGHEGIYDNIPVKFEGIHEVSESESGSEENHTLQEPEDDLEVLEELKNVQDLDDDGEMGRNTPTPLRPEDDEPPAPPPHATIRAESPSPPIPPPRAPASIPEPGPSKGTSLLSASGGGGLAGVVGTVFGVKNKLKSMSPSPPVSPCPPLSPCPPPQFSGPSDASSSREDRRHDIHLPDLPGSPPSLSSLDSPDSQALSRLHPYLPMLPSTPPSVSSLDSPDSQIFIVQPASPPASFANPESPNESISEASLRTPGAAGGVDSITESTTLSTEDGVRRDHITTTAVSADDLRRQQELRQLDLVDFGQLPQDFMELDFTSQKQIADLELADFEHQQSLSGAELAEFQQQREMANLAIANLTSQGEPNDFDLSPTSPFDMLDFSELTCADSRSGETLGAGVTALDFEVIGGELEEDGRRRPSASRDWS
ncbi:uncharacterized protein LOC125179166 [Hyalella azteca]|uniref:Uncharacterized protein LOC125179166 n=1 Tax=Hyalella azteca TaxID=294128 RepID=A0A979FTH6_HYAAZ|nr:uncharacterized protein LOC125179166 [Hyalella azteca]